MTGAVTAVVARFGAFRSVPSRGVAVLAMEVPLGRAPAALELLGTPIVGQTIHVGFTRITGDEAEPPPPLHGTFEKFATVAARESLSISIEVPGEQAHVVLKTLGVPTANNDIRVAIVRLSDAPAHKPKPPVKSPGQLAVQRAGIRVGEEPFQRFLLNRAFMPNDAHANELEATQEMRKQLGIKSRAELRDDHEKLREFWAMEARFEDWLQNGGYEASVARDAG